LLIGNSTTLVASAPTDLQPAASTLFRRFYSIAFDQFGYFSQSVNLTAATTAGTGGAAATTLFTVSDPPTYAGSLFVSDLASGLYVTVTPLAPLPTTPVNIPVEGTGIVGVTTDQTGTVIPIITNGNTTGGGSTFGGRIIRIRPDGTVEQFAEGFDTSAF